MVLDEISLKSLRAKMPTRKFVILRYMYPLFLDSPWFLLLKYNEFNYKLLITRITI